MHWGKVKRAHQLSLCLLQCLPEAPCILDY
uniref:Uncharacterized protein n=1 Tax=Arundo donax TaxID=35708 RepID=A0A0A8YUC6_ARUDO